LLDSLSADVDILFIKSRRYVLRKGGLDVQSWQIQLHRTKVSI